MSKKFFIFIICFEFILAAFSFAISLTYLDWFFLLFIFGLLCGGGAKLSLNISNLVFIICMIWQYSTNNNIYGVPEIYSIAQAYTELCYILLYILQILFTRIIGLLKNKKAELSKKLGNVKTKTQTKVKVINKKSSDLKEIFSETARDEFLKTAKNLKSKKIELSEKLDDVKTKVKTKAKAFNEKSTNLKEIFSETARDEFSGAAKNLKNKANKLIKAINEVDVEEKPTSSKKNDEIKNVTKQDDE